VAIDQWLHLGIGRGKSTYPKSRWYEPNVAISKSYKIKSEDYPHPIENQATYAQLLALKVGPMAMFKSTKRNQIFQKEEAHDVYM
jgi:hypothetical protein